MAAESRDAASRVVGPAKSRDVVGGDSITGTSVAADATFWEGATVWEGVPVDSNAGAVVGAGAFWVDANAEGAAGNGALWEEDDRRSPIMAVDLELDSDPIGSGAQATDPTTNVTSASSLRERESCDMTSSTPVRGPSSWPRSPYRVSHTRSC